MKGKLIILGLGVGIGFLLGSRAGRGPYEKFSTATKAFWGDPRVQRQVDRSVEFANDKLEDVAEIVSSGTRNVVHRLTAPKPATSKTTSRARGRTSKSSTSAKRAGSAESESADASG